MPSDEGEHSSQAISALTLPLVGPSLCLPYQAHFLGILYLVILHIYVNDLKSSNTLGSC